MKKISLILSRGLAALLSVVLVAGPVLADAGQSSLWTDRKRAMSAPVVLASAAGMSAEAGHVFRNLPRAQAASLSPSLVNQLSKFKSPDLKKRLSEIVRALPVDAGSVRDVVAGKADGNGRIVIHIQDVHLNQEAQTNIASAVRELTRAGVGGVVGLEGAFAPIDLKPFRDFPERAAMSAAATFLINEKKMSGPIGVGMTEDKMPPVVGVDSEISYDANVAAYRGAAPLREARNKAIATREESLAQRKRAVFSSALQQFDNAVAAYDKGASNLGAHIRLLAAHTDDVPMAIQTFIAAHEIETTLDFTRVEAERARLLNALVKKLTPADVDHLVARSLEYRTGRLSHGSFYGDLRTLASRHDIRLADYPAMDGYIRYVLLTDSIRPDELYRDIASLRTHAFARLAGTSEEKALVDESERLGLAHKLVNFSLTPDEWERYAREPKDTLAFLGDVSSFEAFYREADTRNAALANNLLAAMDGQKSRVGVLVTGGFHAPGVSALLAKKGVSIVSYVPRLSKVDGDGSAYLSVFAQEKAPLAELFTGPQLFLAETPLPAVARVMAPVLAMMRVMQTRTVAEAEKNQMKSKVEAGLPDGVSIVNIEPIGGRDTSVGREGTEDNQFVAVIRDGDGNFSRIVVHIAADGTFTRYEAAAGQTLTSDRNIFLNSNVIGLLITSGVIAAVGFFLAPGWVVLAVIALPVLILVKAIIVLSVIAHELNHLRRDGQLRGKSVGERWRLGVAALHMNSFARGFISGTDISQDFVNASARRADQAVEDFRAQTSRTAIAGPIANAALMMTGVLGFAASLLLFPESGDAFSRPAIAQAVALITSGIVAATNILLLAINAQTGSDWRIWRTGLLEDGAFRMVAVQIRDGDLMERNFNNGRYVSDLELTQQSLVTLHLPTGIPVYVRRMLDENSEDVIELTIDSNFTHAMAGPERITLKKGQSAFIGRGEEADFRLGSEGSRLRKTSRYHASVYFRRGGRLTIRDLLGENAMGIEVRGVQKNYVIGQGMPEQDEVERLVSPETWAAHEAELETFYDRIGKREIPADVYSLQPAAVAELNERIDRKDLSNDERRSLSFLRDYLPNLLKKSRANLRELDYTPNEQAEYQVWKDDSARLIHVLLIEARRLSRAPTISFEPAKWPDMKVNAVGLKQEDIARVTDAGATHWLSPERAPGETLRIAIESKDRKPQRLRLNRETGSGEYSSFPGDPTISLLDARVMDISFSPDMKDAKGTPMGIQKLSIRITYENGRIAEWDTIFPINAGKIDFGSPQEKQAPRALMPTITSMYGDGTVPPTAPMETLGAMLVAQGLQRRDSGLLGTPMALIQTADGVGMGMASIPARSRATPKVDPKAAVSRNPDPDADLDSLNADAAFSERMPNGLTISGVFDGFGTKGRRASLYAKEAVRAALRRLQGTSDEEVLGQLERILTRVSMEIRDRYPQSGTSAMVSVLRTTREGKTRAILAGVTGRALIQTPDALKMVAFPDMRSRSPLTFETAGQMAGDEMKMFAAEKASDLTPELNMLLTVAGKMRPAGYLGDRAPHISFIAGDMAPESRLVLVTPGMAVLSAKELLFALTGTPAVAATTAVQTALKATGATGLFRPFKPTDDITALVVQAPAEGRGIPKAILLSEPAIIPGLDYLHRLSDGKADPKKDQSFDGEVVLGIGEMPFTFTPNADGSYIIDVKPLAYSANVTNLPFLLSADGVSSLTIGRQPSNPDAGADELSRNITVGISVGSRKHWKVELVNGRIVLTDISSVGSRLPQPRTSPFAPSSVAHHLWTLAFAPTLTQTVVSQAIVLLEIPLLVAIQFFSGSDAAAAIAAVLMAAFHPSAAAFSRDVNLRDASALRALVKNLLLFLLPVAAWAALPIVAALPIIAGFVAYQYHGDAVFFMLMRQQIRDQRESARRRETFDFRGLSSSQVVGEALIHSAMAVARGKQEGIDAESLLGEIVPLGLQNVLKESETPLAQAPASIPEIIAYVRQRLPSDPALEQLSFAERQRIASKLATWLGASMPVAGHDLVSVARRSNVDNIDRLVLRGTLDRPVQLIAESGDPDGVAVRYAKQIAAKTVRLTTSNDTLFTGNVINADVLEAAVVRALGATNDAARLSNALLVLSRDISFERAAFRPGSPLANMPYTPLEELLDNLTSIHVLPLRDIVDIARVLAVQA